METRPGVKQFAVGIAICVVASCGSFGSQQAALIAHRDLYRGMTLREVLSTTEVRSDGSGAWLLILTGCSSAARRFEIRHSETDGAYEIAESQQMAEEGSQHNRKSLSTRQELLQALEARPLNTCNSVQMEFGRERYINLALDSQGRVERISSPTWAG